MKQYELPVTKPVFRLKGGTLAASVLELASIAPEALAQQLAQKVTQAPQLLRQSPVIIALDKLVDADGPLDLAELLATCRQQGLQPVAVRALRIDDLAQAARLGIAILPLVGGRERGRDRSEADGASLAADLGGSDATGTVAQASPGAGTSSASAIGPTTGASAAGTPAGASASGTGAAITSSGDASAAASALAPASSRPTKVITQPVRGGQQIYSEGDLILLAPVSAGAEVMASGHIHVYAPLRGRALAGVEGDTSARIFCREMSAELVAVAGHYRIADDLRGHAQWGLATQIFLHDDNLKFVAL